MQILPKLNGYDLYYFTEHITKEQMIFSYKIHKGIAEARNAIKVLAYIGYPEKVLEKIYTILDETKVPVPFVSK